MMMMSSYSMEQALLSGHRAAADTRARWVGGRLSAELVPAPDGSSRSNAIVWRGHLMMIRAGGYDAAERTKLRCAQSH